jgi:hypothetical protein
MVETGTPGVLSVEYDVTLSWMLEGGDQCLLTRTNARNSWGTEQRFYGVQLGDSVAGAGVRVPDRRLTREAALPAMFSVDRRRIGLLSAAISTNVGRRRRIP